MVDASGNWQLLPRGGRGSPSFLEVLALTPEQLDHDKCDAASDDIGR
jgi:hypothetical protein